MESTVYLEKRYNSLLHKFFYIKDILIKEELIKEELIKEELYQKVLTLTDFLKDYPYDITLRQRFFHIKKKDFSVHLCKSCKKPILFEFNKSRYPKTCSKECMIKDSKSDELLKEKEKILIEKYGKDYKRILTEKGKSTLLKRYGVENPMKNEKFKEKFKETSLKKYGFPIPSQSNIVKEKQKETNIKKYGRINSYRVTTNDICGSILKYEKNIKLLERQNPTINDIIKNGFYKNDYHTNRFFNSFKNYEYKDYYEFIKNNFHNRKYHNKSYEFRCRVCGNTFEIFPSYTSFQYNRNLNFPICTSCNKRHASRSKYEIEILEYIKSFYNKEIKINSKKELIGYEIDIYVPEKRFAVDFRGDYIHMNPKFHKETDIRKLGNKLAKDIWEVDKYKEILCKSKDINLLVIWESDWSKDSEKIKKIIRSYF